MAVFYQLLSNITRGTFTCAVATAAYRSGSHLTLEMFDEIKAIKVCYSFDYSKKPGIAFSAIMGPANMPDWVFDRQILWQTVENRESDYDAHLATEFTIALPEELTAEQNIELIMEFIQTSFISRDMVADVNFHNDHQNNPHLHILCPTRQLVKEENGSYAFKKRRRDWASKATIHKIRQDQSNIINKYLEKYGHASRVSDMPFDKIRYESLRPWL